MKPPDDKLLTVRQVSALIGFSPTVIYAGSCHTDELPKIEFMPEGTTRPAIRFSYLDVMEWIANHRARAKTRHRINRVPKINRPKRRKTPLVKSHLRVVK